MPTYSIDGPDGKTYSIDGPEGASRDQVIAKIKEKQPDLGGGSTVPPPDQPSVVGDVLKSGATGVEKGVIAGLGGLGDMQQLAPKVMGALPVIGPISRFMPTSDTITKKVESVTGPEYQPKTKPGKYAESIGEFAPAVAAGPEGIVPKVAQAILGGGGAEAGAELTEGTGLEPYGRLAGGLIAGVGTGLAAAEGKALSLSAKLPTVEEIKKSAQAAYKFVADNRLFASRDSVNNLVAATRAGLDQRLMDADIAKRSFKALDQLEKSEGDISGIMAVRQRLGEVKPDAGADYEAAQHIRDAIDHYIETLPASEVVSGNAQLTQAMLDHARSSWRAYAKIDQVQTALEIGSHRAATSGTGANTQNAMKHRIREILDSEKNSRGFSPESRDQMEKIVMGTWLSNEARRAGKFAPSGPVSGMASGMAYLGGGPGAAAAVAIPATIAKYLGTYLTKRQIRELQDIIRAESPLGKPIAAANAANAPSFAGAAGSGALGSVLSTSAGSPLAPSQ